MAMYFGAFPSSNSHCRRSIRYNRAEGLSSAFQRLFVLEIAIRSLRLAFMHQRPSSEQASAAQAPRFILSREGGAWRSRRQAVLWMLAFLLVSGSLSLWYWAKLTDHHQLEESTWVDEMHAHAIAGAEKLATRTGSLLQKFDLALIHLSRAHSGGGVQSFQDAMADVLRTMPARLIQDMMLADANGALIFHLDGGSLADSVTGRDYFRALADSVPASASMSVGVPVFVGPQREPVIPFARPTFRNGRFAGIVVILVRVEVFNHLVEPNDSVRDLERMEILRSDGRVLTRNFDVSDFMSGVADLKSEDAKRMEGAAGELPASKDAPGNEDRALHWRRLADYPIIVANFPNSDHGLSQLRETHQETRRTTLPFILGLNLLAALAGGYFAMARDRRREMLTNAKFYREAFDSDPSVKLLIDATSGVVVDANPAAQDFYGAPRERLLGTSPGEFPGRERVAAGVVDEQSYSAIGSRAQHRTSAGELRDVEVFTCPVRISGKPLALATVVDIAKRNELEAELARNRAFRNALMNSPIHGLLNCKHDGEVVLINNEARRLLGYSEEEVIGKLWLPDLFDPIEVAGRLKSHADGLDGRVAFLEALANYREEDSGNWRLQRKGGEFFAAGALLLPLLVQSGEECEFILLIEDHSQQRANEESHRLAEAAFESSECKMITNADGIIQRVNRAFCEATGFSLEEVIGHKPAMLRSGRHNQAFYEHMWSSLLRTGHWEGEVWNKRKNGEIFPEWLVINSIVDERKQTSHFVASFTDISGKLAADQQIVELASYDPLTKLPNRHLLHQSLREFTDRIAVDSTHALRGALLFIDMDNFKVLNDTMGHHVGDLMLVEVANRLKDITRKTDVVARLGGDEFVVLLQDLEGGTQEAEQRAQVVCEKILQSLGRPYRLSGIEHHSSASVGVAMIGDEQSSPEELLQRADVAMYQSKNAGKNELSFYDPAMQKALEVRSNLERELRDAIDQRQFTLYFQPQVNDCGILIGAEALLRWNHPTRGIVPPAGIIPVAEETGLIIPIGHEVLHLACQQVLAWQNWLPDNFSISVNVSAAQFRHHQFIDRVRAVLAEFPQVTNRIKLELTESMLVHDVDVIANRMSTLRELGVTFALDDFGTGYSSLAYLKKLPLDQIKIDKSFVRDILVDVNDTAIARAIIALSKSLSLTVVAEGVETEEQWNFLRDEGCDLRQGYLFAKPLPASDFVALVNRSKKDPALARWNDIDLSPKSGAGSWLQ
jgi:diguanylate cyclase (GGDEF)-like protein/PAS domain S-box-containing protein